MIELNATTNGIAIMVTYLNTNKKRFIVNKEGQIRLFPNMKVAKTVAKTVTGIKPHIEYYFILEDKKYPLSQAYKLYGTYKIVDKETQEILTIREKLEYKASNFSYIVFENGDKERCDKKYGYNRARELFETIASAIEMSFVDNYDEFGIDHTEVYRGEFVIHLRNCTGKIHIVTNTNLMDSNQYRKEKGLKVFPFTKSMDKFVTFYTYISRDNSEPIRFNSEEKALKQLKRIIQHLATIDPDSDPKLEKVNYNGFVVFDE